MIELLIKFDPVTASVNCPPPAVTLLGVNPVATGKGLLPAVIVKLIALLVPPPGVGVKTVTGSVPARMILEAGNEAVNCVGLT